MIGNFQRVNSEQIRDTLLNFYLVDTYQLLLAFYSTFLILGKAVIYNPFMNQGIIFLNDGVDF